MDPTHRSAVCGETLAASSVIEFQTSSTGGDNEGTEITSHCDVWWRCREGLLGKVAVLCVRKLNPYPALTSPLPFGISVGKEINIRLFSYLVFQQLINQWIFVFCAVLNGQGWAQTHSADNWLSMQNLHQDFTTSFAES